MLKTFGIFVVSALCLNAQIQSENISDFWKAFEEDKPLVVMFGAEWCPSCPSAKKKLNSYSKKHPNVETFYLNVYTLDPETKEVKENKEVRDLFDKCEGKAFPHLSAISTIEKHIYNEGAWNFSDTYNRVDTKKRKKRKSKVPWKKIAEIGTNIAINVGTRSRCP